MPQLNQKGTDYVPLWHPDSAEELFFDQLARSISFGGVGRTL